MSKAEVPPSAKSADDGPTSAMPRHVAIIMDGNGRWAAARGLPRVEGHRRGVEALRRTIRAAGEIGIKVITIFSFSSENWSRPAAEVGELMGLLRRFIRNDLAELHRSGVRVHIIGEQASELIHVGAAALARGETIDAFIDAVYNYPTLGECYKYAAYDGLGNLQREAAARGS